MSRNKLILLRNKIKWELSKSKNDNFIQKWNGVLINVQSQINS